MPSQKLKFLAPLLLAGVAAGCGNTRKAEAGNPATAPAVAVVKAVRRDLANNLEIASEFQPFQEIEVYAKVSGYVQKLYVDWGTHVKQGQLLAVLEIPELQQQLQQDEAAVRRSDNDLARAHEELHRAESAYTVAHLTYTRLAEVQKSRPGLVAQQEVDVAQGKDLEARASLSAAQDTLAAAEQSLDVAKAAHEKDKAMYAYARITAPFDGIVTEIYAYTGALLPAGTSSNKGSLALCRLSQNNRLRLVIPVPESVLPEIHIGGSVEVRVPVLKKTYQGIVARFADQVDASTRTMHTEVDVPNPALELVPGEYAEASLVLRQEHNVLAVPVQALNRAGDTVTVLVVNGQNQIEERKVQIGIESPSEVEILSGLKDGELVVVGNRSQLRPGLTVSPKIASATEVSGGM